MRKALAFSAGGDDGGRKSPECRARSIETQFQRRQPGKCDVAHTSLPTPPIKVWRFRFARAGRHLGRFPACACNL